MPPAPFSTAIAFAALLLIPVACDQSPETPAAMRVVNGSPHRGAELVRQYGCPVCHHIPGVRAFSGTVGPPLGGLAKRAYIAGGLPNKPDNVVTFIVNAPLISPQTAMPNMGVTPEDARHMTAHLYGLP